MLFFLVKKLYSSINCGEYAMTIEMAESEG